MNASEQLQEILNTLNINAKVFSEKLGMQRPQGIYDILNGKAKTISPKMADKIVSVFPEYSRAWLLSGEGDMFHDSSLTPISGTESDEELDQIATEARRAAGVKEYALVPLLPLSAIGGALEGVSAQGVFLKDCEFIPSPIRDVDFAITVYGDSMKPKYPSGTKLFIKEYHPELFIEPDRAYVLDTANGVIVKNVKMSSRDGYILCKSENKEYSDFEVALSDVRKMYRILLSMSPE